MVYVACELISGDAHVADSDEIAEIAWCKGGQLADYIPHKLFPAVQDHLDATLVK
jgi:8-oxo-dGTP diphosphatase